MRSSSSPPKDNRNLKQEHQESHSTNNTDSARAKVTTRPNSSCRMPPHSSINQPCVGDIDADSVSTGSNWGRTNLSQMRQMQWSSSSEDMLFPSKLFLMLVDAHEQDFEDIVSWGHGPSSFNVHKKNIFQHQILPKYFKMTKYKSFTKQLHNYDFKWIRGGPDKGGYCHRYFSRDGMHLDQLLSRKAIEGAQAHGMMLPISAARQPLKLVSTRAHRWSSPALLFEREITMDRGSSREHSSAEWNSSSVDDDPLLLDRTDHDLATRNKSDPLSISTHSGGYLLPPLQAPSGKANPLTVASWSSLLSRPQERRTTGGKQPYEHNDNVEDHCLEKKTSSPFVNVFDDVTWFGDSPRAFSLDTTTTLPPPPSHPSSSFLTSGQVENPLTRHALGNYHPQFSDVAHPSFNIFPRFHPDTDTNNPSAVPADLAPTMDREDLFLIPHHSYHQDFPPPSRTMRNSIGRGDTHDHHERSRRMPKDSASNSPGNEDEEGEKMMTLGEALPILEPRTIEEMLENKTSYQQK